MVLLELKAKMHKMKNMLAGMHGKLENAEKRRGTRDAPVLGRLPVLVTSVSLRAARPPSSLAVGSEDSVC